MNRSKLSLNVSEEIIKVEEAKKLSGTNVTPQNVPHGLSPLAHDNVDLVQDNFGVYYDENGDSHNILRFTWRNRNKIHVQVINYGARITSIKMPDRRGSVDDIVLGFDDLAGYLHNKDKYIGATIGRMTNVVKNSTFHINNKQYWLSANRDKHHYNGGRKGLDQVVWTTFVEDKKVIMTHVSPHMSEGYPGDLLITVSFELSSRNEFEIRMEAHSTQPTILNLSNLTYFNLAGHHRSPTEIYKHMLTLNCNCFTPQTDSIPTGEIMNVVHSGFDFQIPKLLGKVMGIIPKDGFNQNLCVNRGMNQDSCFVARILHPPSGRLLEVYSNQSGVNLSTANDFGFDSVLSMEQLINASPPAVVSKKCEGAEPLLRLYEKVHEKLKDTLGQDQEDTFRQIYGLIKKIKELDISNTPNNTPVEFTDEYNEDTEDGKKSAASDEAPLFSPLQMEYLSKVLEVLCDSCDEELCQELKDIIKYILLSGRATSEDETKETATEDKTVPATGGKVEEGSTRKSSDRVSLKLPEKPPGRPSTSEDAALEKILEKKMNNTGKGKRKSSKFNSIPDYYKVTKKIIGKDRAHYTSHSGISIQTQNYPGCANYKNFPNCVLKPGESYVHTITYKFWIRAGNPSKWIKRNLTDDGKHVR